jgi:hypothetical protein
MCANSLSLKLDSGASSIMFMMCSSLISHLAVFKLSFGFFLL